MLTYYVTGLPTNPNVRILVRINMEQQGVSTQLALNSNMGRFDIYKNQHLLPHEQRSESHISRNRAGNIYNALSPNLAIVAGARHNYDPTNSFALDADA